MAEDEAMAQRSVDFEYLSLCGARARHWLQEFRDAQIAEMTGAAFDAVKLCRCHDVDAAHELLAQIRKRLDALRKPSSMLRLLERWYLSAQAYERYMRHDFDGAVADLVAAHNAVSRAISLDSFLQPVALHCTDFRIQRARVARSVHNWEEVVRLVGEVRRTFAARHPICVLDDGTAVDLPRLRAFYKTLRLSDQQREEIRFILDEEHPHYLWIDRLEEQLFMLPDFVIPYP